MQTGLTMVGIELVVTDLDRAVEMFTDVLGCTLLSRGPSGLVVGEVALIDANGMMVSLLQPASSGAGTVLAIREPRLSQIVFAAAAAGGGGGAEAVAIEAGFSVVPMDNGGFHLSPESVEGALGLPIAIVVTPLGAE